MPSAHRAAESGGRRSPVWLVLGLVILAVLGGGIATAVARDDTSGNTGARSATTPSASTVPSATPSSSALPGGTPTGGPTSSSPTSSPLACPAPSPGATNAANDLFTPPTTWVRVPDATARTGPVDIETAAALDGTAGLSTVGLRQLCFERGISRQWQHDGVILVALVYTFGTVQGAQAYGTSTVAARDDDEAFTAVEPGPGAPAGAHAFTTDAAGSRSRVIVFVAGRQAAVLGLVQDGSAPDAASLAALAAAQAQVSASTSRG